MKPSRSRSKGRLARVGSAFFEDRSGFAPDQLGATGAEAPVAAEGQLVGPAVGGAVAALHRLDAQRIAHAEGADRDRPEEGAEVVAEAQVEPEAARLGLQVVHRMELEEAGHGVVLATTRPIVTAWLVRCERGVSTPR